jgi:SAM-dependent methyltransferase
MQISEFAEIVDNALNSQTLVKYVLSDPVHPAAGSMRKISVRPVHIRGQLRFQAAMRQGSGETHENLSLSAALDITGRELGRCFLQAHLQTETEHYTVRVRRNGELKVNRKQAAMTRAVPRHDREKQYLIPDHNPCRFLEEIGVMTAAGKVRASKQQKFLQVNRFLELVDDALPRLPSSGRLQIVDFGCGKSYLTFALHFLLTALRGREVNMIGLDRNPRVVQECNAIARRLGISDLEFVETDIDCYQRHEPVNMCVCLHACDTATDDALCKAIEWNSDVILAVPCCQHELAEALKNPSSGLNALMRHGILKERFAALATDALRSELLEQCGYQTQVVEFVDLEHTAKNLLIRAIRGAETPTSGECRVRRTAFKKTLGLDRLYLESLLDLPEE